ncbi:enoyl-CoA hydratase/isomerase family protein [Oceanobacter kriegii]|uniref:enoyl-CoA hydratase/isomerase family protein n=1 Tax=Oceanobacter kriegii TaxID=64972 RepID=UPI000422B3D0|nr:enoyl-CoA hydratase/isomerase family protein [Oceanobacter kriegii]
MSTFSSVLFQTVSATKGYKIGVVTLNRPEAMNALDFDSIKAIRQRLKRWKHSPKIAAVVIHSSSKHFSCGGDIRDLYNSIADEQHPAAGADRYFELEYQTNVELQRYGKPLITVGNGYTMGGGLGLFLTGSHRIALPDMKLAWPEIKIGLFPDVLAAWYLPRIDPSLGLWMGVTATPLAQADIVQQALATHALAADGFDHLLAALRGARWAEHWADNHFVVRHILKSLSVEPTTGSDWQQHRGEVEPLCQRLLNGDYALPSGSESEWVNQGVAAYHAGCPASARVFIEQFREGWRLSQAEVARRDLELAWQACRHPDLKEGIRAMIIDKDKQPVWQHASVAAVPDSWVKELMTAPWPRGKHPLKGL